MKSLLLTPQNSMLVLVQQGLGYIRAWGWESARESRNTVCMDGQSRTWSVRD